MKKLLLSALVSFTIMYANSVPSVVEQNGCTSCHNVMGKNQAPGFTGIAKKNKRQFSNIAKNKIEQSIKNGSMGQYRKFIGKDMPSYSYLTKDELEEISTWILSLY